MWGVWCRYRIEVSEDMLVSLLLTQQQSTGGQASDTYRRILAEVRHETGADERGTGTLTHRQEATRGAEALCDVMCVVSESRYAGMEEVAAIADAIRSTHTHPLILEA